MVGRLKSEDCSGPVLIPELIRDSSGDCWVEWKDTFGSAGKTTVSLGRCYPETDPQATLNPEIDLVVKEGGEDGVKNATAVSRGPVVIISEGSWGEVNLSLRGTGGNNIRTVGGTLIPRDEKNHCILTMDTGVVYLTVGNPVDGAVIRVRRDPTDPQKISVAALRRFGLIPDYSALWDDSDLCFLKLANRVGVLPLVSGRAILGQEIPFSSSVGKVYGIPAVDSAGIPTEVVVGRIIDQPSDVIIDVQQKEVSKRHFVLKWGQAGVTIRDLGSKTGTVVNRKRISGETPLVSGDLIQIGLTNFTFVKGPKHAYLVQTVTDFISRPDMY